MRNRRPGKSGKKGHFRSNKKQRHQRRGKRDHSYRSDRNSPSSGDYSAETHPLRRGKAYALVEKNRKGFAFLLFDDRRIEDRFVPPEEARALFHLDRVLVHFDSHGSIREVEIVAHHFNEMVGKYEPGFQRGVRSDWLIYERKKGREVLPLTGAPRNLRPDDWIKAKVSYDKDVPTAHFLKHYGPTIPASADIDTLATEFNLEEHHSASAVAEAKTHTLTEQQIADSLKSSHNRFTGKTNDGVPYFDIQRKDLRNLPFITIDGETARDFDDAVYVESKGSGYVLYVAIADVSHYVRLGSAVDADAVKRATSVYFPERAFHMLPGELSENLCSLRPKVPRFTLTSEIHLTSDAQIEKVKVYPTIIQTVRRANYTEIQEEIDQHAKRPDWEYQAAYALYLKLKKARKQRGSIDFELPEAEVLVDEEGEPTEIKLRPRKDAHRLIEEFMICANEAVTEWIKPFRLPFLFRVHDEPEKQALENFKELVSHFGIRLSAGSNPNPNFFAHLIENLHDHPAAFVINYALLRSMKQAVYSPDNRGHFGLASKGYTHFTSPIRRYPDLIVHRILRWAIAIELKICQTPQPKDIDAATKYVEELAAHCSHRERLAAEADREAIRLKQTRLMSKHLGEVFDGQIIGVSDRGIMVRLLDPFVEGLIPMETLAFDSFEFNEKNLFLVGRRTKRIFKIGDKIKTKVLRADIDRRLIDFALEDLSLKTGETGDSRTTRASFPAGLYSNKGPSKGLKSSQHRMDREKENATPQRGRGKSFSGDSPVAPKRGGPAAFLERTGKDTRRSADGSKYSEDLLHDDQGPEFSTENHGYPSGGYGGGRDRKKRHKKRHKKRR